MSIRVERLHNFNDLTAAARASWNRLNCPSPMQSLTWLEGWWGTFGESSDDELCLLLVWDGDDLVGVAPWYLKTEWTGGRCLRFLGDGLVCSDHASLLCTAHSEAVVIDAISKWLRDEEGATWHSICFEAIDQSDHRVGGLIQKLEALGCETHLRQNSGCWSIELPKTWDEYLASLSRNHRKRCRRWIRNHFESGQLQVVALPELELASGWQTIAELNEERRQQKGDRSVFADQRFSQFHLGIMPALADAQQVEIRELRREGTTEAVEYLLKNDDTLFCYQSGLKTTEDKDGLGNLSILSLFHSAIERGYRRIDFLRGDEGYKAHWGATRFACVEYHVASRRLQGTAVVALHRTVDWVKDMRDVFMGRSE